MIITEYYKTRSDGVILNRTYSNSGYYIIRDGIKYSEAIDPAELNRTYIESTEKIEEKDEEVPAEKALSEIAEVLK